MVHDHADRRSINQTVALVFGAIYTLVGIAGFFLTSFDNFASSDMQDPDKLLGLFQINPLHNIVHILIGLFLLGAARAGHRRARQANLTVGAAYFLVFLYGLFAANKDEAYNFLALNNADNLLHIATALVLLGVALGADKDRADHPAGNGNSGSGSGATRI